MTIKIFGSPSRYIQGPGALERLGELTRGLTERPAVVVDADVLPFVEDVIAAAFPGGTATVLPFRGEVTRAAIAALTEQARAAGADLVVGIGGGKGLDAAKGVCVALGVRFIAVPSIASNDSPTGRSLAVYDDNHLMVAIDSIPHSPVAVIADTRLIANAPARFLRSGMGDAIAKKFEAERAAADGADNFFDAKPTLTALVIADACYRTLRQHGVAAMAAAEAHRPDDAFEAVVEANILMAGLGFESGGLSYAHAVVRGLVKARGAKAAPHGEHVAYGALVQLAIEGRSDAFIQDVADFNRQVGLPASLGDLGMDAPTDAEILAIGEATTIGPKGGKIIVAAAPEEIAAAVRRVEALAAAAAQPQLQTAR